MPRQYTRTCAHCGDAFGTKHPEQRFCSHRCSGLAMAHPRRDFAVRFWAKVDRSPGPNGCWTWIGTRSSDGYGSIGRGGKGGGMVAAHRAAWEMTYGPIPDGLKVLHNCPDGDNPSCVNPAHLFLGTNADNSADMVAKERQARGERVAGAVLTEVAVSTIRAAYAQGATQRALAHEYGVSSDSIWRVVHRKTWAHVA